MPRRRSNPVPRALFPCMQVLLGLSIVLVLVAGLVWWQLLQAAPQDKDAWVTWDFLAVGANYSMPVCWRWFL